MTVSHGLLLAAFASSLLLTAVCGVSSAAVLQDTVAAADEDLMKASPLTVAQCRAGCLYKVKSVTIALDRRIR